MTNMEYRPKAGDVLIHRPRGGGAVSHIEIVDEHGRAVLPAYRPDGERYAPGDGWILAGELDLFLAAGALYRQGDVMERITSIAYPMSA